MTVCLTRTTKPVTSTRLHLKILADTNALQIRSSVISGYHLKLCCVLIADVNIFNTETISTISTIYIGVIKQISIAYHIEARHSYITWRDLGKSRHGSVCDLMKVTRLRFKYALRQCQTTEETARADAF